MFLLISSASRRPSSTAQYLFFPRMCKCLCSFIFPSYFSIHYITLEIFFPSYLLPFSDVQFLCTFY
jgi:hypothetical protein